MSIGRGPEQLLPEDATYAAGEDLRRQNVAAAHAVADAVRSTFGPFGMNKALITDSDEVVITRDGATILTEMDVEHPVAKMIAAGTRPMAERLGNGTTATVLLASALLGEAERRLEEGVHPSTLIRGYHTASDRAREVVDRLAVPADDRLVDVARTALDPIGDETARDVLASLTVDAVTAIDDGDAIPLEMLEVNTVGGGSLSDSRTIDGIAVDKDKPVLTEMPWSVTDADVAIVSVDIDNRELKGNPKATVESHDAVREFRDHEREVAEELARTVIDSGADVVFCIDGIDDYIQHRFADAGIMAFRRVKYSDRDKLIRATGANVIGDAREVSAEDFGYAGSVRFEEVGNETRLLVEDCQNPESTTILVNAGTAHAADEVTRLVEDAARSVRSALLDGRVVPGGGATETAIGRELESYADGVTGREQLAIRSFGDAVAELPRTLAANVGEDPVGVLAELRSRQAAGDERVGFDAKRRRVTDVVELGVVEPHEVKTRTVTTALDVATAVLRVDGVVAARQEEDHTPDHPTPEPGVPPEML